ncbi:hypothetical protein DYB32_005465 [Aphanomyces invadans]|uniref:Chromo domain-containing protein n=1 Tax=Aphanomyces invadans TaxID=157072 RepID=A0A3R6WKY8_9STRA|nr:hypothetical protein DYB32_005465 [Aphanomyces invadans]
MAGPQARCRGISDWIFVVEDLVEPFERSTHHASRLRFYHDKDLNVTEGILSFARYNEGGHMVRAFGGVRPARDSFEVMVYWLGLSDDEATWEPLSTLLEDVPILLQLTIGVYAIQWTLTTAENKSIASSAYAATTVVYTFVLATSGGVVGTITTLVGAASTTITADLDLTKANFTALKEIDDTCSNENRKADEISEAVEKSLRGRREEEAARKAEEAERTAQEKQRRLREVEAAVRAQSAELPGAATTTWKSEEPATMAFHHPEAVYADFRSSGILRRSGIDVSSTSTSRLHQREALFDVALAHGLSSVIALYVLALQDDNKPTFLLQEPVAVQTWVRSHVDRAQATAVHATSPEDLHATLRQVRGLRHVVQALIERLQRGQQAALPTTSFPVSNDAASWNPSTDGSLEYLVSLQDEITSVERMVEFNLWLMSRFQSSTLSFPSTSKMLHAILSSAGLVDLLPLPVEVTALLAHFQSVDAHTTSAIMLFLTLYTHDVRATTSNVSWAGVHAIAMEAATVLHLPRSHATHVLALWTVDHATSSLHRGLLKHACTVLSQSPPEFLDGHVVVAILEILLQLNEPQLAHTIATTCQVSLARETEDLTLLLLMLDICLRLDAWEVAWLLARRAPQYIETTMARLVEYHQARGNVRDVLLKMTWTPAEMAMWKSQRISANDQALLHLVRYV